MQSLRAAHAARHEGQGPGQPVPAFFRFSAFPTPAGEAAPISR
ncbi:MULTISPECIES: DNA helicase [Burkholderia]|nr:MULTISPECIES: DNA helicase [Burkholderia]